MNEERCTLHMKINKKMLFASTVALSVFPLITANAEEESQNCTILSISANLTDRKSYLEIYQYLKDLHDIRDIEMNYA